MAEFSTVARSPIAAAPPAAVVAGWEVSTRRSHAALRLADQTPVTKLLVRGGSATELALGVRHGRAVRDDAGQLVVGLVPGQWLLLARPAQPATVPDRLWFDGAAGEWHAVDLTHGIALVRLTGTAAPAVLSKVCAVDLASEMTPNGVAFRSSVARLVADVARDDRGGEPSYLLGCDRSYGQYLFDAVLDAGGEFGIDVDGFHGSEV